MSIQKKYVTCVGDVCVDLIVPYGEFKQYLRNMELMKDPDVQRPQVFRRLGGTSGNTILIASALGAPVMIASKVSAESHGNFILKELNKYQVNTDYLRQEGPDGLCMVAILDNDDREMMIWNDNNVPSFFFEEYSIDDEIARKSSIIHFAGVMIREDAEQEREMIRFAKVARETGCKCTLDLNLRIETWGFTPERRQIFDRMIAECNIVFGSGSDEFEPFTGIHEFGSSAIAFSKIYSDKTVIARDGANDVLIINNGEYTSIPTLPTNIVNKVGAGDAFDAGFLTAYAEDHSIEECVKYGIAVASYTIGSENAHAVPSEAELKRMIAAIGNIK